MVSGRRKVLERMWKDRCWVYVREEYTDSSTNLTDFRETVLLEGQSCKLSFKQLTAAGEGHTAAIAQGVKLFLSPDLMIPPGCKILVQRFDRQGEFIREFTYAQSGEAGVFADHQEIPLELWKGWA